MEEELTANNTTFFHLFNEDLRPGGRYYKLEISAFKALMAIHANVDKHGVLSNGTNKGYRLSDLEVILGLNSRTIKKALMSLQELDFIKVRDDGTIIVNDFVYDNKVRLDYKGRKARSQKQRELELDAHNRINVRLQALEQRAIAEGKAERIESEAVK